MADEEDLEDEEPEDEDDEDFDDEDGDEDDEIFRHRGDRNAGAAKERGGGGE